MVTVKSITNAKKHYIYLAFTLDIHSALTRYVYFAGSDFDHFLKVPLNRP